MNKPKRLWLWIVLGIVVLLAFWAIGSYNHFVTLNQNVNAKWSEVENQYQRQADLIPNLVSVTSSAVSVETKFVKDVIAARTNYQDAQTLGQKDQAGVQLTNSVTTFVNAVAENYPQLLANTQYVTLTDELSGTQNRITTARGRYIESIQAYNSAAQHFPSNIIASMFGFGPKDYYHADINALKTPTLGTGQLPQ